MLAVLYDEEEDRRIHDVNVRKEVAEKTRRSDALEFAERMVERGYPQDDVASICGLSVDEVERIVERLRAKGGR